MAQLVNAAQKGHALFGVPVIEADDVHAPGLLVLGHLALVPAESVTMGE